MATYYNSDAAVRAARLFKIVTLIASRRTGERIGREQLAAACDCTVKTIQRDIQCLLDAHIPIEYDPEIRSYTLPARGWVYPLAPMTATDVMALAIARGLLVNTPALPFAAEIAAALEKVTAGLTPALRSLLEAATNALADQGGSARDYSRAPVGRLLEAIAARQTVEMNYESRSSRTTERRAVDPYRLDRRDGRYFELQAWCHRRQQVRTFALDRIADVQLTGRTFTPQPWEESDEGVVSGLRSGSLIPLEVRFDPVVASYARERRWGFTVTFEDQADGSLVMRGVVRGTDGIIQELLSWKRLVTVLGGPELRAHIAEEARAIASLYMDVPSPPTPLPR
jgi:predicted DNA-binding transcriptional regulator YafY